MITAAFFREGDLLIGRFHSGVRAAEVSFLDRHSDALCFVDPAGHDLGPLVGGFTTVDPDDWDRNMLQEA